VSAPRFLVVRFSAIGDCVMAAWAATAIREQHPDAFLCWAVETRCARVVDTERLVNDRAEFPRDRWKRNRWSPDMWREQLGAFTRLRTLNFDYGIDLQGHSKTALCLRIANPKQRIAARATDSLARALNPVAGVRPEGMHMVEWNLDILSRLGEFPRPTLPLMPDRSEARGRVSTRLKSDKPLATIAVSAGQPDKAYPLGCWRHVGDALVKDGFQVAYVGGPGDPRPDHPRTLDWVGELRLDETMEAIRLSAIHLAGDTGTGHIAAALGVPVVSVFGPTDPAVFRPYTLRGRVLREGRVTENVAPEWIVEAARELMNA
jgi:ADP-heptose:LPS heptosyltransferase